MSLGDISEISTGPFGTMLHKSDYVSEGIPIVNPQNISSDGKLIPNKYISKKTANSLSAYILFENDVVIGRRGEMGRCAVVPKLGSGWLCGTGCFVLRNRNFINSYFLTIFIKSEYTRVYLSKSSIGATMDNLNHGILKQLYIPLPPLAEQHRIVAAIESAFAVIDEIEHNKTDLLSTVTAAKSKILSLAIRGKLVSQDSADEPASVLLERIRAEKEALIKAGKIKRGKGDSAIVRGDDNSYYADLPDSWTFCRLGEVCIIKGGKRIPRGKTLSDTPTKHIYIRVTDMKNNTILNDNLQYISEDIFKDICKYTISKDDIYVTIAGTIGNVGVVPSRFDGMNLTENAAKLTSISVDKHYLMRVIQSKSVQEQFTDKTTQVSQPKLALERIATTIIAIPPLAEQHRIVTAIEAAFEQLDNIAATLK